LDERPALTGGSADAAMTAAVMNKSGDKNRKRIFFSPLENMRFFIKYLHDKYL